MRLIWALRAAILALLLAGSAFGAASAAPPASMQDMMAAAERQDVAALSEGWNAPAMVAPIRAIGPEAIIDYYLAMGRAFDRAGRPDLAREPYGRAVAEMINLRGRWHVSLIESYRLLGEAAGRAGRNDEASAALGRAEAIARQTFGPDAPETRDLVQARARYRTVLGFRSAPADLPPAPPPASAPAPWKLVDVYYAAERRATGSTMPSRFYSGERGPMTYGKAVVSVPAKRAVGEIPMPSVFKLEFKVDPEKHFILTSVGPIDSREGFLGAVGGAVGRSREKEAFVFVPGFNTTFEGGVLRTAQLAADLQFDGAPILFSWPSRGDLFGYGVDARQADSEPQADALAAFLEDVARRTGAERITLVAHSMGNRVLLNALSRMTPSRSDGRPRFDEVVLAAPDVGVDRFSELWPQVRQSGGRFTLYASRRDKALQLSAELNGMRRLGDANPLYVDPGLDSIDTTNASGGLIGHDDFAGTALDDFRAVVWLSLAPSRRCVLQAGDSDGHWWLFGGACPVEDFRNATAAVRIAGDAKVARDSLEREITTAQGPARDALSRLKAALLLIVGN